MSWHARGVIVCISPWNFPLAIFCGQVVAALVCGNVVLAKPAAATPLIAHHVVELLHQAGIPKQALIYLPIASRLLQDYGLSDPRLAGVAFTGSSNSAEAINRQLAQRNAPLPALIAETGGVNAMIADSSALPEQLVQDVLRSAFNSAGQRCSALRVLFIQEEIAARVLGLLTGACDLLILGDPMDFATDLGPMIDQAAAEATKQYVDQKQARGLVLYRYAVPKQLEAKAYFGPTIIALTQLSDFPSEVFAPVLHLYRFKQSELDDIVTCINASQNGLTLGIHSRVESTIASILVNARVGNIYVNRDMVGAQVGAQPFGGEAFSGTGPKAGGPNYLQAFMRERVVSTNTTAIGGNASLLMLEQGREDTAEAMAPPASI